MTTLYKDTGYETHHLISEIEHGALALPDIQRPFVWSAAKVRNLFDSLYRGYPIGTLMFWETGAEVGTRQIGGGENDNVPRLLVVDGQQRLTALYAVMTGSEVVTKDFSSKSIRIAFNPGSEAFEVTDAAIERDPEFISDITALWGDSYRSRVRAFLAGLETAREGGLDEAEADRLEDRIDRVRDLSKFRFQVIVLNANTDEGQVAEIFVRTNSEGVPLTQADFILTLMSVHWEKGRVQLEEFARGCVDPTLVGPTPKNPFIDANADQLLRAAVGLAFRRGRLQHVYNILRGKDLETGQVSAALRDQQFERLRDAQDQVVDLTNWHEYLKALAHAGFRSRKMITSEVTLIYSYVLWLIGRCDFGLDYKTLRGVIARWFFMAHTTGRYTSSSESQIESDLGRIEEIAAGDGAAFCNELDRIVRANFTGDFWKVSLPTSLDTSSARTPYLFAYWAALNLLDAELLFSNIKVAALSDPGVSAPRAIERHHLFPKKYLADQTITSRKQVNAIANMAYLDWPENMKVGAHGPSDYWPTMIASMDGARLERQRYWHALPIGWEQLDYATFLERRRDLIATVVHDGFSTLWDDETALPSATSIDDFLAAGESQRLEYKSTARWNLNAGMQDKKMEHVIVKAVCGLLNADGGTLLIGVDDDGNPLGLDHDLPTLGRKQDLDGYELFLRQLLDTNLSSATAGIVNVTFEKPVGKDVCVVSVSASAKPVYAKPVEGTSDFIEFWVRVGNQTKQLHGQDADDYRSGRWG